MGTLDMSVTKALLCGAAIASLPVSSAVRAGQAVPSGEAGGERTDPHRLPCTTAECRRIESFLKQHYCAEFPYGNGSSDERDLREPKRFGLPEVKANARPARAVPALRRLTPAKFPDEPGGIFRCNSRRAARDVLEQIRTRG
jgi:hypothetical protein